MTPSYSLHVVNLPFASERCAAAILFAEAARRLSAEWAITNLRTFVTPESRGDSHTTDLNLMSCSWNLSLGVSAFPPGTDAICKVVALAHERLSRASGSPRLAQDYC